MRLLLLKDEDGTTNPDFQPQRRVEDQLLQVVLGPTSSRGWQHDCGSGSGTSVAAFTKTWVLPREECWDASNPAAQSLGKGSRAFALRETETNCALPFKVHRRPECHSILHHMHPEWKLLKICLHYSNSSLQDWNLFPWHICFTGTNMWRWILWINRLRFAKPPWVKPGF